MPIRSALVSISADIIHCPDLLHAAVGRGSFYLMREDQPILRATHGCLPHSYTRYASKEARMSDRKEDRGSAPLHQLGDDGLGTKLALLK
jgi:hypothetical protein